MMEPRKGKILEPPTLKEVIQYTLNEFRSALLNPRRLKRSKYNRHSRPGSLYAMLTIIAIIIYIFQSLQNRFSHFSYRIPVSAYVGVVGFFIASLLLHAFMFWPAPTHRLDVATLVNPSPAVSSTDSEPQNQNQPLIAMIPSELYRDSESDYMVEEPFVIDTSAYGPAFWTESNPNADSAKIEVAPTPLPDVPGVHHTIKSGETLWDIAQAYRRTFKVVDYESVLAYNADFNPRRIKPGDKIFIPGAEHTISIQQHVSYGMSMPLKHAMITSGYGLRKHPMGGGTRFHHGVDFRGSYGQSIYAVLGGTVVFAGNKGQLGNMVEIKHSNGLTTVYGHASKLRVKRGDRVARGQLIANVGRSGRATGTHLHFEVRKNGKSVDPTFYLKQLKSAPRKYARR